MKVDGMLGWALAHGLARLCGASFGFASFWPFTRVWGDAPARAARCCGSR